MRLLIVLFTLLSHAGLVAAAEIPIVRDKQLLRSGTTPEWNQYSAEVVDGQSFERSFEVANGEDFATLVLRQIDVKQDWQIRLNDQVLGSLIRDENDLNQYIPIPSGALLTGQNRLSITSASEAGDDVWIGPVRLIQGTPEEILNESSVSIRVSDAATNDPIPCRITVTDAQGVLQTVGVNQADALAVRPGVIYCDGTARFGLPTGQFTIYATRGPEYGIDSVSILTVAGERHEFDLQISREVDTSGYISCDPHIHTLELSGHGDATVAERVMTIAGEGIELPITTEHNRFATYEAAARDAKLDQWFTPVVGNEYTTRIGHFNIFPAAITDAPPDPKVNDWGDIKSRIIPADQSRVAILNHARDVHSGFRPFGPEHRIAVTMRGFAAHPLPANAMEIINSGAQQTDVLQVSEDWMRLQNRGVFLTPIGASDSHDVSRYIVGQARTYIRYRDENPGAIDVDDAIQSLLAGEVLVSLGLFCEMSINRVQSGQLVPHSAKYLMRTTVQGPSWIRADRVKLYRNGHLWQTYIVPRKELEAGGEKWSLEIDLPPTDRDQHWVAIAEGQPLLKNVWPIAKPYQPTSPDWSPKMVGVSGAIWIDADGNGQRTTPIAQAAALIEQHDELSALMAAISDCDIATVLCVFDILESRGFAPTDSRLRKQVDASGPTIKDAFALFADSWRSSQKARVEAGLGSDW
jgi:hypothetical protein